MAACSVCGCEPVEARGLCHAHYLQWRGGASFDAPLIRTPKGKYRECKLAGCGKDHYAKGLCRLHYQRQWAGVPLEGSKIRGETHGKSKLTEDAVRRIRELHSQGWTFVRLSTLFDVSDDAVRDCVKGRTWRHI